MRKFALICVAIAAFSALAAVTLADAVNNTAQAPNFNVGGAGQAANTLSFQMDASRTDDTTINCTMNPTGGARDSVLEDVDRQPLEQYGHVDDGSLPVVGMVRMTASNYATPEYGRNRDDEIGRTTTPGDTPEDTPPPPSTTVVPEPATMMMIGVGIAGLIPLTRRYRRENKV